MYFSAFFNVVELRGQQLTYADEGILTEFPGTREGKCGTTATGVRYVPDWARRTVVRGLNKNARITFAERFGRIRREQDLTGNMNRIAPPMPPRRENRYFQSVIVSEKGVTAGLRQRLEVGL